MRYKAWPYYNDWVVIFGKDRATGEKAHSIEVTINNMMNNLMKKENDKTATPTSTPFEDDVGENNNYSESENVSFSAGESNTSSRTKERQKRKRTPSRLNTSVPKDPIMIDMMSKFFTTVHSQMGDLIYEVGHEHDVSVARKKLF